MASSRTHKGHGGKGMNTLLLIKVYHKHIKQYHTKQSILHAPGATWP